MSATPVMRKVRNNPGIYKRGDRYVVVFREGGKQRKRFFGTLDLAREFKGRHNAGERVSVTRAKFDEYAREWIHTYQGRTAGGVIGRTREAYRAALERYAIPFFGPMRLDEVDRPHVKRFVTSLSRE